MKRASIIAKQGKPELAGAAREVTRWLREHGYSVTVDTVTQEFCPDCELGELGFLTEIKQDEITRALTEVDAGRCGVSLRSMIHCQVQRNNQCVASYDALNDIVVNQRAVARITEFEVRVNGTFVATYKADG